MKNSIKNIIAILVFVIFCYLMTVINLYKSTGKIEFNIFKSEALTDWLLFVAIALPLFYLLKHFLKNKKRENFK